MPPTPGAAASSPARDGHIHGLDGLRSVAILAVLVFHLRPLSLPGGYLGVDVFFVISGFLITTLLVRELRKKHKIDLRSFWTRRARRLLPALVTVVLVSVVLALFAGNDLLVHIERQVIGALTFSNNWVEIHAGSSYFNTTSPQLFVNFWSLAVEEQFYLVWPLVFVLLMATTRTGRQRVGLLLALASVSAVLMAVLYTPGQDSTRVYYGTDTHAFGLMIGAAMAISAASQSWNIFQVRWYARARVLLGIAGLVGLVALMLWLDPTNSFAYRGGILLASLCTAAIIGSFPGQRNLVQAFFDLPPLVWIGQRSYGIYMWHWPVILLIAAFAPAVAPDSLGSWIQRGAALVLSIALAAFSFRWIENPVRRNGFKETFRRIGAAIAAPGRLTAARIGAGVSVACLVLFSVAIATAPDRSQVEIAMDEAAGLVGGGAAAGDQATGGGGEGAAGDEETAGDDRSDQEQSGSEESSSEGDDGHEGSGADGAADDGSGGEATDSGAAGLSSGEDISGFGDSMMYVAAPGLTATFPGMEIDAVSNRQWPDVRAAIEEAIDDGSLRDVVIIAAGTNAGVRDQDIVRETLDEIGPDHQVVLVNIYGSSFWVPESNENLTDIAADYPNVVVADWHHAATEHPDQLQPDNIHPDMDGMYLYADVVQDALEQLAG
ncbi:acyltransferase family protein [Ruania albidiflava]|uniref:acyltransferase family protein n=1 Tax=Ruania albidiflava TaxID=366586 RepID=UPI0003B5EF44|nr:acyltransferase family protein [Ruania albidiflava]